MQPGVHFLNDATDEALSSRSSDDCCEILEQLPETSAILVPMGDTALIRGIRGRRPTDRAQVKHHLALQGRGAPLRTTCRDKKAKFGHRDVRNTIAMGWRREPPEAAKCARFGRALVR